MIEEIIRYKNNTKNLKVNKNAQWIPRPINIYIYYLARRSVLFF